MLQNAVGRIVHWLPDADPGKGSCRVALIAGVHVSGNPNLVWFEESATAHAEPDALFDVEGTGRTWHDPLVCPFTEE